MTSLYDLYETNLDLEQEGVWVEIAEGIELKVAALGNPNHQEAMERFSKPYKSQMRQKTIAKDIEEDLHMKAIAKAVLVDWKGVTDRKGKEIVYSFENAYKLLTDPSMRRFKSIVLGLSTEAETFKSQEVEEAIKN